MTGSHSQFSDELDIIHYIRMIIPQWRTIARRTFIVAVLSSIVVMILPLTFTASTVIMPPEPDSGGLGGGILGSGGLDIGAIFTGGNDDTDKLVAILKSRVLADAVISRFNFMERWESKYRVDAIEQLGERLEISLNDEGMIRITMQTKTGYFHPAADVLDSKHLAAEVANYVVTRLDTLNAALQSQQARYTRILIENLYNKNMGELATIEQELKVFGSDYGIISLEAQVEAAIRAAATLEENAILTEVQLATARQLMPSEHPQIREMEIKLEQYRRQLREMRNGGTDNDMSIFPAFEKTPDLGVMYGRLVRRIETETLLYQFLTQQYEQAKVQEAKNTPTIQILDHAVIPERKSAPNRTLLVLAAMVLAVGLQAVQIIYRSNEDDPVT